MNTAKNSEIGPHYHTSTPCCYSSVLITQSFAYFYYYEPSQKFNVLWPDVLEAKAKATLCRGQGQGSLRPRPQNFVLEVSSRSRPVLEDPIPDYK